MKARIPKQINNVQDNQNEMAQHDFGFDRNSTNREIQRKINKFAKKIGDWDGVTPAPPIRIRSPLGFDIYSEYYSERLIEEVLKHKPKVLIDTNIPIMRDLDSHFKETKDHNDFLYYFENLPYDDMLINIKDPSNNTAVHIHMIIKKKKYFDHKANIESGKFEPFDFGIMSVSLYSGSECVYPETATTIGLVFDEENKIFHPIFSGFFLVSTSRAHRKSFRDRFIDHTDEIDDTISLKIVNLMMGSLDSWCTCVFALNNPEIREIWETNTREQNATDKPSVYMYNNQPLRNIKRIYMCEHNFSGREITRRTDKWLVREHKAHSKYGKEFTRKEHYKGPKAKDDNVKVEPRKRKVDTYDQSNIDRDKISEFMSMLKDLNDE